MGLTSRAPETLKFSLLFTDVFLPERKLIGQSRNIDFEAFLFDVCARCLFFRLARLGALRFAFGADQLKLLPQVVALLASGLAGAFRRAEATAQIGQFLPSFVALAARGIRLFPCGCQRLLSIVQLAAQCRQIGLSKFPPAFNIPLFGARLFQRAAQILLFTIERVERLFVDQGLGEAFLGVRHTRFRAVPRLLLDGEFLRQGFALLAGPLQAFLGHFQPAEKLFILSRDGAVVGTYLGERFARLFLLARSRFDQLRLLVQLFAQPLDLRLVLLNRLLQLIAFGPFLRGFGHE